MADLFESVDQMMAASPDETNEDQGADRAQYCVLRRHKSEPGQGR